MPVKPTGSENEQDFIGRCMSEEKDSFPDESQRYAVCKSKWDAENMSLAIEDTSELIEPKPNEGRDQYLRRCIPTIYKEGGEYDQRTATAMCADRYENSNTLLSKQLDSFSSVARKIKLYFTDEELNLAEESYKILSEKFADGEGVTYPWEECIADQTKRYGDEETAKKVCGYIKSEYGS